MRQGQECGILTDRGCPTAGGVCGWCICVCVRGVVRGTGRVGLQGAEQEWVDGGQALYGDLYSAHVWVMQEICQRVEGLRCDYDVEREC